MTTIDNRKASWEPNTPSLTPEERRLLDNLPELPPKVSQARVGSPLMRTAFFWHGGPQGKVEYGSYPTLVRNTSAGEPSSRGKMAEEVRLPDNLGVGSHRAFGESEIKGETKDDTYDVFRRYREPPSERTKAVSRPERRAGELVFATDKPSTAEKIASRHADGVGIVETGVVLQVEHDRKVFEESDDPYVALLSVFYDLSVAAGNIKAWRRTFGDWLI